MAIKILNLDKYKAIVFDFDGVIVESNIIKHKAFYDIWEEKLDKLVVDKVLKNSGNRYTFIEQIYNQISSIKPLEKTMNYYIDKYGEIVENKILESGVKENIIELLNNESKILFINSATPDIPLQRICFKLGIENKFKEILGQDRNKIENFNYISQKYGIYFGEMIFLGDMKSDEICAKELKIDFFPIYSIGSNL